MGIRKITDGRNAGKYQIDWRDEYRKRHRLTLGYNFNQARDVLAKKITARAEERSLDVNPAYKHTFYELIDSYLDDCVRGKKASAPTDEGKCRLFKAFFGDPQLGDISKDRCKAYAVARKKVVSGSTVNREMAILKPIFEHAIDNEWLEANPVRKWKEYEEPAAPNRVVEWGEYRSLLDAVDALLKESGKVWRRKLHLEQFRYIIPIGFECGGRREEIMRLKWDDIDFTNRQMRFTYRKGKRAEWKERWVPMSAFVLGKIQEIPLNPDTPYLFPDESGNFWKSKISFYRLWDKIVEAAKVQGVRFHTLRHSYSSHLANNNVDTETRMELMGHTSVTTQMRYTHMANERKRKAAEVMDRLAGSQRVLDGRSLDTGDHAAKVSKRKKL